MNRVKLSILYAEAYHFTKLLEEWKDYQITMLRGLRETIPMSVRESRIRYIARLCRIIDRANKRLERRWNVYNDERKRSPYYIIVGSNNE